MTRIGFILTNGLPVSGCPVLRAPAPSFGGVAVRSGRHQAPRTAEAPTPLPPGFSRDPLSGLALPARYIPKPIAPVEPHR